MRNLPINIELAAKRIAAKSGESVEGVIKRFSASVRKTAFSRDDFFRGYSDISLGVDRRKLEALG